LLNNPLREKDLFLTLSSPSVEDVFALELEDEEEEEEDEEEEDGGG
tara:strand:+ start:110 stop:247 length:138 start_codon:yes stop_codon:yes gene_type:complete